MTITDLIEQKKTAFEADLHQQPSGSDPWNHRVWEAMQYSLYAGGKRLRPLLIELSYEACGGVNPARIRPFQYAMEMIHTYSLIHDDLPAMDNDDYRRGKLTCHKAFDEATAILAGDGLLNLAYEVMSHAVLRSYAHPEDLLQNLQAMQRIAEGAGARGMVAGQMADLIAEIQEADEEALKYIEAHKTGALICASFEVGGILGGAGPEALAALHKAGEAFGRAFQIQDDILDVEGDQASLGKSIGKDERDQKATFVTLYGLKEAKAQVEILCREAMAALDIPQLPGSTPLRSWIEALIYRKK